MNKVRLEWTVRDGDEARVDAIVKSKGAQVGNIGQRDTFRMHGMTSARGVLGACAHPETHHIQI